MRVALGGLAHDRETVPDWLEALAEAAAQAHRRGIEVLPVFVCDGDPALWRCRPRWPEGALVAAVRLPGPQYRRQRDRAAYQRLATLRNLLASLALDSACEALVSVDSDVLARGDLVWRLAEARAAWAGAPVRNDSRGDYWSVFRLLRRGEECLVEPFRPDLEAQGPQWSAPGRSERDLAAGACAWYSAELLRAARWATNARAVQEDVGFAAAAHAARFRACYVPDLACRHLTVGSLP